MAVGDTLIEAVEGYDNLTLRGRQVKVSLAGGNLKRAELPRQVLLEIEETRARLASASKALDELERAARAMPAEQH